MCTAPAGIDLGTFGSLKEWSNRLGYHPTKVMGDQNEKNRCSAVNVKYIMETADCLLTELLNLKKKFEKILYLKNKIYTDSGDGTHYLLLARHLNTPLGHVSTKILANK